MLKLTCFCTLVLSLSLGQPALSDRNGGGARSHCHFTKITPDLNYHNGFYVLDTVNGDKYPFGAFAIHVDRNDVGHVQSFIGIAPVSYDSKEDDSIFVDWKRRTSFIKRGKYDEKIWTQLTFEDARNLWGEPRKNYDSRGPGAFFTFDASNSSNLEPNIYHLDFKFDANHVVCAYRVRGIGIGTAQWITPEWQPPLTQKISASPRESEPEFGPLAGFGYGDRSADLSYPSARIYPLSTATNTLKNYPFNTFEVSIDSLGTAHLEPDQIALSFRRQLKPDAPFTLSYLDWGTRTSVFKATGGWTQLSLEEAKSLWGEPRNNLGFFTFDARTSWMCEPNIYHIDLKFDNRGDVSAYRIRGIGIGNAQWDTADPLLQSQKKT
jgi:hypothetical protein